MNDIENRQIKLTLPFVNKGQSFFPPVWTCELHEAALAKFVAYIKDNKLDDKDTERMLKYFIIHESLLTLDQSVKLSDLTNLNFQDVTALFEEIYNSGRLGVYFQEPVTDKEKKKSTGTKS